jgi:cytidine deaminase
MTTQRLAFSELSPLHQRLVRASWRGGSRAFILQSNFMVGSGVLARNDRGAEKIFHGCNMQNDSWGCNVCSECSGIFSARTAGYFDIRCFALVFPTAHSDGVSPCGICRQVMRVLAPRADFLSVVDAENTVIKRPVSFWLPEESVGQITGLNVDDVSESIATAALAALKQSYAPYSGRRSGVALLASNGTDFRLFVGSKTENASYGATISGVAGAVNKALTDGYLTFSHVAVAQESSTKDGQLVPVPGDDLQILTEGGMEAKVMNVSPDGRFMRIGTLDSFLPLSFGRHSLTA